MTDFQFDADNIPTKEEAERQELRGQLDRAINVHASALCDLRARRSDVDYSDECLAEAKAALALAEKVQAELYGRALPDHAPERAALARSIRLNGETHDRHAIALSAERQADQEAQQALYALTATLARGKREGGA